MEPKKDLSMLPGAIVIAAAMIMVGLMVRYEPLKSEANVVQGKVATAVIIDGGHILSQETEEKMLTQLVKEGVIDPSKLPEVTELNLLWAFGLANKNPILDEGPISSAQYGSPARMASVGGWSVSRGDAMDHFSKHTIVTLTPEQQALVEKVSKGIFRPCCNNSTYFPDCNHGMAMLGLLEYMVAQGSSENDLWNAAMSANTIWFPDTYKTIGQYMKEKGIDMRSITPPEILGAEYSSASGFAKISSQVKQPQAKSGSGGCSVGSEQPVALPQKQGGCGI